MSQTAINALKLSKTTGENFEICWPQKARNALKLSKTTGENFEICRPQTARNALKLSTMVGENFEIKWFQLTIKTHLKNFHHGRRKF